jgi:galactose-1-phosphate uridylyltransferase
MNNPPAFPGKQKSLMIKSEHLDIASEYEIEHNGMTLRDYMAAKAMQAFLMKPSSITCPDEIIAQDAYNTADAMLAAREQK